jgi:predicted  nucleic acid-binding Zn-ribbon protein
VGPRQEALLAARRSSGTLAELRVRRDAVLELLSSAERRVYESFHASGRPVVVAVLTEDGACGNCFNMVPLQLQNEIRGGAAMAREVRGLWRDSHRRSRARAGAR